MFYLMKLGSMTSLGKTVVPGAALGPSLQLTPHSCATTQDFVRTVMHDHEQARAVNAMLWFCYTKCP